MLRFVATRLLTVVPLLLLLTLVVFGLVQIAPGDPAAIIAGPEASPEAVEQIRADLGLDRPVWEQYLSYIGNAVQGDLGTSYTTNEPVTEVIGRALPRTVTIAVFAMLLAVAISLPLGVLAALRRNRLTDRLVTGAAVVALAVPPFVLAALLVNYLALGGLQLFPPTGYEPLSEGFDEWFRFAVLPAIAIATISLAELTRQARGSLIDAMEEDYVRTARAKGLGRWWIVGKHAAKNAAVPYVTVLGLNVGRVVGAAVIVEAIFNIQGFGQLGVDAVLSRDLPTMQGVVLVSGVIVLLVNLAVDISYGYFNPRVRAG
ncbi:ABC transporter permease [Pseudonocardia kunmingensis]|uniref:Peptide/nickel transport system permease protein n=1 Tax=Pseudonocardia kunmingensis TaxID=630975 RepID=A0A543DPQ1_9PSEU|nr:ABC transporter permease [Pseudonocardia kunmingensis]TQM11311.1 peptide/nickel transport system permease protein [Pseudonocardia kunmingensis]